MESNAENGTRSKSTERALKVAADGFMFLAFEVCCSRGPDGIHQLIPPDMMMVGGSGVLSHLNSLTVTLDLMWDRYIRC